MKILKKLFHFFWVSLAGLIFVLLLLEIALRILGYAYQQQTHIEYEPRKGTEYVILCLGDSFTAGMGAPRGKGYPSQLNTICKSLNTQVEVVNRGFVQANTSMILENLPENLSEVRPNMIIAMMGGANDWNYYGENRREKVVDEGQGQWGSRITDAIYRLRVYKLYKLISRRISDKISYRELREEQIAEYKRIKRELTNKISSDTAKGMPDLKDIYKLGGHLSLQGKNRQALEWYKLGNRYYPAEGKLYLAINEECSLIGEYEKGIAWLYRGYQATSEPYLLHHMFIWNLKYAQHHEAGRWLLFGLHRHPEYPVFYRDISVASSLDIDHWTKDSLMWFVSQYEHAAQKGRELAHNDSYLMNYRNEENPHLMGIQYQQRDFNFSWMEADYEELIEICKQQNITLVVMTYPYFPSVTWEAMYVPINNKIREIAQKHDLILVDQARLFNQLGPNKNHYYHPPGVDDHPNSEGYLLMAKNILQVLKYKNLINKQTEKKKTTVD